MIARTSWIAKLDKRFGDASRRKDEANQPIDDILDARFDSAGRIEQGGRGNTQRAIEQLDPRTPAMSAEELERAVRKLALGLEAIERQGGATSARQARNAATSAARIDAAQGGESDFVVSSLDRLEARLEALSQKLKQRSEPKAAETPSLIAQPQPDGDADAPAALKAPATAAAFDAEPGVALADESLERVRPDPSLAVEAESSDPVDAMARASGPARFADAFVAAKERRGKPKRGHSRPAAAEPEMAESGDEPGVPMHVRDDATDETRRRADEAARLALEGADVAHRAAAAAEAAQAQFAALEARIEAFQGDPGHMEPLREELVGLLRQIEELRNDRKAVTGGMDEMRTKLDEVETKVNAGRNLTGNRLSDLQDRMADLAARLGEVEAEVPGFDAVRESQSAILERFDHMEGVVLRMSPEQVLDRVDGLKRDLQALSAQREVARIEQGILGLAGRLDALPEQLADPTAIERVEAQLQALATDFADARKSGESGRSDVKQRLADLYAGLKDVAETGRTPDLSGLDERLSAITSLLETDRNASSGALERLDQRLAALTESVESHESSAAAEVLSRLTGRMDELDEAIKAQDATGARRDLGLLDRKLDQIHQSLAEQAAHLSRPLVQPFEHRFDALQGQVAELAERAAASNEQLGPLAQKLQEISERVSGLGAAGENPLSERLTAIENRIAGLASKGPDPRAIHNQLDNVVSRLELLKGRSIDPGRLLELFDRVETAIRGAGANGHLERIEQKLEQAALAAGADAATLEQLERIERRLEDAALANPAPHFQRLERQIAETRSTATDDRLMRIEQKLGNRQSAVSDERFAVLESKLDDLTRIYAAGGEIMSQEDLNDLRGDIVALRRELRSLPGLGEGEGNLGDVLKAISAHLERQSDEPPASASDLERQIDRIAQLLEDPSHSRLALAHIETSLKTLQENLDEARRAALFRASRDDAADDASADVAAVTELARALSDDVGILRQASETTEKRTRDALEAVHGTLEAVVKRMAFLERDADRITSGETMRPAGIATISAAAGQAREAAAAEPTRSFTSQLPELAPAHATTATPSDAADAGAPVAKAETSRDAGSGGLFSRFTSSQLLKRATGGRTDSFSPDVEDIEESDLPLEPGTDSPLTSALTGAPSSDTERLSGTRSRDRKPGSRSAAAEALRSATEPLGEEDFLSAARRAAQAAAAEASDAERDGSRVGSGLARMFGRGRTSSVVLAGALVAAAGFAAVQIIRGQLDVRLPEIAGLTTDDQAPKSTPVKPKAAQPQAPRPATVASLEPARPTVTASAGRQPAATATAIATSADKPATSPAAAPARAASVQAATPAPVEAADDEASESSEPLTTASLPPDERADEAPSSPLPQRSDGSPGAAVPAAISAADLPAPTGPQRLRDAAAKGDPAAAFEVAARYAEGRGGQPDPTAAVAWYQRASELGVTPAQYRLGSIYEKGMGVPKDLAAAQNWYRRAADAGNVKAMHNLAVLYAEGAGGAPDLERAAALFRTAAEHGVRDSQFNLAILHARGLGVRQDMPEAFRWFAVAAGSGDAESLKRRDIIGAALAPADRSKAEAAAAAYQPRPLIAEANDVAMPESGWGDDVAEPRLETENDLVALVQKLLADKGYDPGPADGMLGQKTIEAINEFQQATGLEKTGRVDTGLVAALQKQST